MNISNQKIYEQVADIILENIKSEAYQVGDKLPSIQNLSKQFGVSIASVREALNALRTIGIIEMKQGYGTFVKQLEPTFFELGDKFNSLEQIKELLELREIVESATVANAARYRNENDLSQLKKALKVMSEAVTDGTSGEKADLAFHLAIANAAQNTLLVELLNNISELMQNSMEETRKIFIYNKQKTMTKLLEEHEVIYHAILKRDDEVAVKAMQMHLLEVKDTILANFKEQ
ncbi:FadR/GntR family transcriptional regulator [Staphylococcus edaphicus]|uniref:Transcriptional regulator n=1 Tax=Staphylococcus edaphicus TaxID=1955013 RepID=A0A2C6WLP9_9STAP|nr:FadR/GntR family transcriptional regulator [Staphylococcus edaphicus]PHK49073.1 transcriptional regulator [Staphylococcus edaphicus]UQW82263.1 FadR family transcriptional regulator [Staphylococcus edaphicus]